MYRYKNSSMDMQIFRSMGVYIYVRIYVYVRMYIYIYMYLYMYIVVEKDAQQKVVITM